MWALILVVYAIIIWGGLTDFQKFVTLGIIAIINILYSIQGR